MPCGTCGDSGHNTLGCWKRKVGQKATEVVGGWGGGMIGSMGSGSTCCTDGGALAMAGEQAGKYLGGNPLWNTPSQRKDRGWG